MTDPAALLLRLTPLLKPLLDASPVFLAYLYGSMARGEDTHLSDMDIAILTEGDLTPLQCLDLEMGLELALEKAGYPQADVREVSRAPIIARGRVLTQGKELYCRDEEKRMAFEIRTRREYLDFLPFWETSQQLFFEAARNQAESES
jgi:hypothetical protein